MTITHRTQDTGWNQRYGDPHDDLPPVPDSVRVQLAHRSCAVSPGDVTDDQLRALVAAAQSAPTSSNLQPWSVVAVRDPARKARLAALAAGQASSAQAPVLLVWVADLGRAPASRAAGDDGRRGRLPRDDPHRLRRHRSRRPDAVVAAESLGLGSVSSEPSATTRRGGAPSSASRRTPWPPFGLAVGAPTRRSTPA